MLMSGFALAIGTLAPRGLATGQAFKSSQAESLRKSLDFAVDRKIKAFSIGVPLRENPVEASASSEQQS